MAPASPKVRPKPTTKPSTDPKTKPGEKVSPKPRRSPFKVPRPKVTPRPQNALRLLRVAEAYDDEAHPGTTSFFRQPDIDPLSDHPLLTAHGDNLARGSFDYTANRLADKGASVNDAMGAYQTICSIEAQHASRLEDLARKITAKVWGIDVNMLEAELTDSPPPNDTSEHDFGDEAQDSDHIRAHTHMRATLNILSHGAAVHNMMTVHHLVKDVLDKIDPRLMQAYDVLGASSTHQYWFQDIRAMMEHLASMVAGSTHVDYGQEDGDEVTVKASAICFPVLCQELSKGVMQLLSGHHLSQLAGEEAAAVLKGADDIRHEPWFIMVGPELWRKFLKLVPRLRDKVSIADVVASFASMEPAKAHEVISFTVSDPDKAVPLLQRAVDKFIE